PKKKQFFNLFGDGSAATVETIASHELVHALQDQYFDLDRWFAEHDDSRPGVLRDDDRVLALRCVVEGEATLVQSVWQLQHQMHLQPAAAIGMARMSLSLTANMELEQLTKIVKAMGAAVAPEGSDMAKSLAAMDSIDPYVLEPLTSAYINGAN